MFIQLAYLQKKYAIFSAILDEKSVLFEVNLFSIANLIHNHFLHLGIEDYEVRMYFALAKINIEYKKFSCS